MKKRIINIAILASLTAVAAVSVLYYADYLNKAEAAERGEDVSILLPEGHPKISSSDFPDPEGHCLACHKGIEPARPLDSPMMKDILGLGAALGDPNGCVVCHGGNPSETSNKDRAHHGAPRGSLLSGFTPVPGALHVNENTCGQCHSDHTYNVHRSLMNTDAGKMKAITWSFGIGTENKDHVWSDHDIDDPDGGTPRFGTEVYVRYMKEMAEKFPGQYPDKLVQIPEVNLETLQEMPEQAAFSYLRNCNACHLSSKGLDDRGHHRGMGCAACHSMYSNEGYYEGGDTTFIHEPGHLFLHSMQGTRKSAIKIGDKYVSGVQVSTCAACHAAGRRIGHAYQGLMALGSSAGRGPFDENGNPQMTNAGYVF